MPTYRAQVVIPMFSGLPSDVLTNTLHFDPLPGGTLADAATLVTPEIQAFYNTTYISSNPMGNYMVPANTVIHWYDLAAPPPRAPLTVAAPLTPTLATTDQAPESAVVLSFQGALVSGTNRARRRGRIYLGGLGTGWMLSSSASTFPRVNGTAVALVVNNAETLALAADAAGYPWSVWSQVDQASTLVTNGWVDNAIDTQRRRGVEANLRTPWSATFP